jgi:hypothetical protein
VYNRVQIRNYGIRSQFSVLLFDKERGLEREIYKDVQKMMTLKYKRKEERNTGRPDKN